jgi:hypothetical protein
MAFAVEFIDPWCNFIDPVLPEYEFFLVGELESEGRREVQVFYGCIV